MVTHTLQKSCINIDNFKKTIHNHLNNYIKLSYQNFDIQIQPTNDQKLSLVYKSKFILQSRNKNIPYRMMICMIYLTQKAQEAFKQQFKRLDDVSKERHKGSLVIALKEDEDATTTNDIKKEYSMYALCFNRAVANKSDNTNKRVFWEGILSTTEFVKNIYATLFKRLKLRMLCQEPIKGQADVIVFSKSEAKEYEDKKDPDGKWPCAEVDKNQEKFFENKIRSLDELSEIVQNMKITKASS